MGNPTDHSSNATANPSGKGRPTPKRKDAQTARTHYIASSQNKETKKLQRQKEAELRERARTGMMQGDERFLPARDKGPQRKFVRDVVDARISVGEFLVPAMVLILVMTFLPAQWQVLSLFAIWGYLGVSIFDAVILGFSLKKKLERKFGKDQVKPGYRWYAAMRAMQFRLLRMPKPQVKRFEKIT